MSIAASGMAAAMTSLTASASNIANADSTGPVPGPQAANFPGSVYQPAVVVQTALPDGGVSATVLRPTSYAQSYNPSAPFADAQGMVATPNVDLASEMVNQLQATLAFRANLKMFQAADRNAKSLLDVMC